MSRLTPRAFFLLTVILLLGCSGLRLAERPTAPTPLPTPAQSPLQPIRRLAFLGEAILETGLEFQDTTVGGLSALTYDAEAELYFALSDDPSYVNPTRIYGLDIDLDDGHLETGDVTVETLLILHDRNGKTFPTHAVDGEGLALSSAGTFFISSEGNIKRGIQPFIREIAIDGSPVRELPLPDRYRADPKQDRGLRHNLAFEALTLTPDESWLFAGIENALAQDGPEADLDQSSPSRILRYDLRTGQLPAEYLYQVDPVPQPPATPDGFRVNGLVDLLALEGQQFLALERSYSAGVGNSVRLYLVDLASADDIHGTDLPDWPGAIRPASKTLILDLAELGITLDNLEGLTHGPQLPDGRHTLLLISDDNFSPRQKTQILAFAWSHLPVTLSQVQGAGHRSPYEGEWVFGLTGLVTAVDGDTPPITAWMQDAVGDNDHTTSDGLRFETSGRVDLLPGDELLFNGRVLESSRRGNLSVTRVRGASMATLSRGNELPGPVSLSSIPSQFDDDALSDFEPWDDALDLLESLEGMRVEIPSPVVVGAPSRFGDFVVLAADGGELGPRTGAGGILLTADSGNPQRLQIDPRLLPPEEKARLDTTRVGASFSESLVGVLDYSFGAFEIVLTEAPGEASKVVRPNHPTGLSGSEDELTLATFNVENLDALDPAEKYGRVAATIALELAAPDIVGLQEIQDENGVEDNGTVSASGTLARLIDEIVAAGGPRYDFHQVDPEDNADGGQPGSNIRVAYLVNPERVVVTRRGTPDALTATMPEVSGGNLHLSTNPGRIAATDPVFAFNETLGYEASRKALALEVEFAGRQLFLVNAHLKSKRGDEGLSGAAQPPRRISQRQRSEQANRIRSFVEEIQEIQPGAAIVVLGDLNDHEFRPPVKELAAGGLVNLIDEVPLEERYTYNFGGNSQVLDHILVSPSLAENASPAIDIVHVNADAPASNRASDHDPVVVRLRVRKP